MIVVVSLAFFFTFSTPCAPPNLTILISSNNLIVSWPATGLYALQTNSSLATDWGVYKGLVVNSNGTNSATFKAQGTTEFFCLQNAGRSAITSPTNITGMTYYWNYNDLPQGATITGWTDELKSVALIANGLAPKTIAYPVVQNPLFNDFTRMTSYPYYDAAPGLSFFSFSAWSNPKATPTSLANNSGALTMVNSNFTFWIVYRSFFPTNANWWLFSDNKGDGICIATNTLASVWNGTTNYSSFSMIDPHPDIWGVGYGYGITYDIVDAGGTVYSNGVKIAVGIGQPTNDFPFSAIGSLTNYSAMGQIQYVGIWSNTVLSSADVSNLDQWYWSYNNNGIQVTNITNGIIAWWKLNDGNGTSAADFGGTNTMIFGGIGNAWTNTGPVYGESLSFNGNGWMTNVNTFFADNMSNMTVTCWLLATTNSFNLVSAQAIAGIGSISKCSATGSGWYMWPNDSGGTMSGTISTYSGWGGGVAGGNEETNGPSYESSCSYQYSGYPTFPAVGDGNWHFITMICTNYVPLFFVDGAQYTANIYIQDIYAGPSAVTNDSCTNVPIAIGGGFNTNAYVGIPGTIEDVRIYNRILNNNEIDDLYKWRSHP